jgi:cytochrome c oxidase subunit 2
MTRRTALMLAAVAVLVAGCVPTPVTAEGRDVATLYNVYLAIAAVVAAIVVGLTTFAIVRYRGRSDVLPEQTRGSVRLEAFWTALPAITVAGLFVLGFVTLVRVDATEATPGAEVEVSAFRWGWSFTYPAEGVTVNGIGAPGPEIVVPVDEPVRFRLTAADVVHAFYVPQFLLKRDMYPGRENVFQVTIEEEATYRGQCAEFCGLYHSKMPFAIRAVSRADYDAWLAAQPRGENPAASVPVGSPIASAQPSPSEGTDPAQPLDSAP